MSWNTVTVEKDGPVALVTFDRGGNLNAFNQELILELTEAAQQFHGDLETQAVVLTGTRAAFSAGADLTERATRLDEQMSDVEQRDLYYRGVRLCDAWESMQQVTIAAVERMAVGAGVAIALACDWRLMGKDAFLYVPEVKIGLNLQWGALPRLVTLVGPARAKRICILCEKMGSSQALDWGLVDEVADDGVVAERALELAREAAAMPAATVRMVKEAVNAAATALHKATRFADADQSWLTSQFADSRAANDEFNKPE